MPLWGRNDQSVTANSSTTVETSNGAPIGTHALVKSGGQNTSVRAGGANAHWGNTSGGSRAAVDVAMFGNTTTDAFIPGAKVGVFGIDAQETQAVEGKGIAHAGWVLRTEGTGGRAGRVFYETLVAMGSLGAQSAAYGTPANPGDAEDTVFPDYVLTITTQPDANTGSAAANQTRTFSVAATTTPSGGTPTYVWYFSNTSATAGFNLCSGNTAFANPTTATLSANVAKLGVNTWVRAVVSVTGGASVNSNSVKYTATA